MSEGYDQAKVERAKIILGAISSFRAIEGCLDTSWTEFVPYLKTPPDSTETYTEYIWSRYLLLRMHAFEWLTDHRLLDLAARIEALEQPNGGRLGDHR